MDQVAEKLIVFDDDEVSFYANNYATFLKEKGFQTETETKNPIQNTAEKVPRAHRGQRKEQDRLLRPLKKEYKQKEKTILRLETEQRRI